VPTDEHGRLACTDRVDEMAGVGNPATAAPAKHGINQADQGDELGRSEGRVHGSALPRFE
jgi:hypothetical protein